MLWARLPLRGRSTTLCDKVCQWLAAGRWFSPDPPVSSTNKTDRHDITEILLKMTLNTLKTKPNQSINQSIEFLRTQFTSQWRRNWEWDQGAIYCLHCLDKNLRKKWILELKQKNNCPVQGMHCLGWSVLKTCPLSWSPPKSPHYPVHCKASLLLKFFTPPFSGPFQRRSIFFTFHRSDNIQNTVRDRAFNLKGGGGYGFFSKKIFWFPMLLKKIFWFWWRKKKKIWFRFFTYNLMFISGKKKYSNSCVVRKNISERNKKP